MLGLPTLKKVEVALTGLHGVPAFTLTISVWSPDARFGNVACGVEDAGGWGNKVLRHIHAVQGCLERRVARIAFD